MFFHRPKRTHFCRFSLHLCCCCLLVCLFVCLFRLSPCHGPAGLPRSPSEPGGVQKNPPPSPTPPLHPPRGGEKGDGSASRGLMRGPAHRKKGFAHREKEVSVIENVRFLRVSVPRRRATCVTKEGRKKKEHDSAVNMRSSSSVNTVF